MGFRGEKWGRREASLPERAERWDARTPRPVPQGLSPFPWSIPTYGRVSQAISKKGHRQSTAGWCLV